MVLTMQKHFARSVMLSLVMLVGCLLGLGDAKAQVTGFKQAVAEAAAKDRDLAAFYQSNGYKGIWTGNSGKDRKRRQELFKAIEAAGMHGLPVARYDAKGLKAKMKAARSPRERGFVEVALSKTFVQLSRDMQTGILVPSRVDEGIKRKVPYRNRVSYLTTFAKSNPRSFFRSLPPRTNEYSRLMKEKIRLLKLARHGGWGQQVPAKSLKPGASGNAVVILRNRLISMGYLRRSSSKAYDANLQKAIQQFQQDHGLNTDGVAGPGTMVEINRSAQARLQSVMVAMERERWLNQSRGDRHVLVNLTDFSARIIDGDRVSFQTRAVVGKNVHDRRSPEFSDVMEFLVINPTWNVPRSIAVKEYLPMMKRNPNAAGHLQLYDGSGRKVSRAAVDFSVFTEKNFPFDIKQPPSRRNALGLVKFMFPNKYNIYLHDTPQKELFAREKRDFSHGCIRLHQPFDFAYAILSKQERDPKGFFHTRLDTGRETVVQLEKPVPVHITYRTAFTQAKGRTQFPSRRLWPGRKNLEGVVPRQGFSLGGVQG